MTIDLGQISERLPSPQPAAPRPPGRGPRVAVLLLLLFALIADEAPVGATLPQVALPPVTGNQEAIIVDGAAGSGGATEQLLLTPELAGPTGSQLTVRRLPGLEPVWQVPVPFDVGQNTLWAVAADDVLLVEWWPRNGGADPGQIVALDRADGTTRWRREGSMVGASRTGPVLLRDELTGALQSIDPGSGRLRWSEPVPEQVWPLLHEPAGSTPAVWVLFDRKRGLEVRDLDSNRLLSAREVPLDATVDLRLRVTGDVLVLGDEERSTAYGLPDLEPRWEASWRFDDQIFESQLSGCGEMPCLAVDADGLRALDPRTGTVRWSSPRWRFAHPAGESVLLLDIPLSSGSFNGTVYVADLATGEVVRELGSWKLLSWFDDSAPMIGTKRISGGRLMLAVLHPTGPEVLAIVDDSPGGCARQEGVIICRRSDNSQVALMVPDEHRTR